MKVRRGPKSQTTEPRVRITVDGVELTVEQTLEKRQVYDDD